MKNTRSTEQKKIILDHLRSVKTHPTAQDVFEEVRKKISNISLATVYRNLENFAKEGLALMIEGDTKRFDGDTTDHQHFVCEKCGKVYDIFCPSFELKNVSRHCGDIGKTRDYQVYFYGTCNKCLKDKKFK